MKKLHSLLTTAALALGAACLHAADKPVAARPTLVFFLADDLG